MAVRIDTTAQILNFASWVTLCVLRATARNFIKFNQAAVNFKILSTQRTLVQA
ncbi:hypothetical protein [uncultured Campylobacter sp.]|uniref:hypothetical protein n=1 Tax=uncultured Campylobacter sp. TaxID=218934 RepID=UPI0026171838|nr:hypothetical protein [uncultured Campylobacter sp.]